MMTDFNAMHAQAAGRWPEFTGEQTVIGWKLLDFLEWIIESKHVLDGGHTPDLMPVIALPPLQRSAVWRPRQVLDLWDSLMRGLPIGTFYLVSQPACPRNVVVPGRNQTIDTKVKGFNLLDGQQRVRALVVGVLGPADEQRCLWVDLGAETASQSPCLRLTSKAQPFGYVAETGGKLPLDDRRKARERIEPDAEHHPLKRRDAIGGPRRAYDLELFDDEVIKDGKPLDPQPPLPYSKIARYQQVFKLQELLAAWRKRAHGSAKEGIAALRTVSGGASELEAPLQTLHEAFCNVEKASVALLKVDPSVFHDREDLLTLFERIGAAGTPLSRDERLYSIYKHYEPRIRDLVNEIHRGAGHVLPATKIVATALRIASARTDELRNNTPDPAEFAKAMTAEPISDLRRTLASLLPVGSEVSASRGGTLSHSFATVKSLLSYEYGAESFWLPDIMLATLPLELWQVLVFWASIGREPVDRQLCRKETVRFALFWRLCVWNDEKAAATAFEYLREDNSEQANFPGLALYQRLIGQTEGEPYAHALLHPDEFERRLCKSETAGWLTDEERFVENNLRNDIGSNWWWHGRKMLPWLQRDYIRKTFPGYVPLTDHEDDLPYDVDHICPSSDWGQDWRSLKKRLVNVGVEQMKRMQHGREAVGHSIGNLRLVDSSINRFDQDADISKKMPSSVEKGALSQSDIDNLAMSAFPLELEHRELWSRVSSTGDKEFRTWDQDRLQAFQRAVELRAAWLYQGFYNDLNYAAWIWD